MQCYKCQHEWQDTPKAIIGLCPGCGTNLLQSLTNESKEMDSEYKLQYIIQFFGYDILQHRHIIYGIVNDLFAHNSRLRYLIITSIKLNFPDKIKDIDYNTHECIPQESLKEYLLDKTKMTDMEAEGLMYDWKFAIPWEKTQGRLTKIEELLRQL